MSVSNFASTFQSCHLRDRHRAAGRSVVNVHGLCEACENVVRWVWLSGVGAGGMERGGGMLGWNGVDGLRWSGGGERRQDLAVHVIGWLRSSFPVSLYFAPILPVRMVKHVEVQRSTWSVKFRFSIDRPHQRHVPCLRGTSCGVFVCMMRWHVHAARSLQYATSQCSKRSAPLCITQHAHYGTDTNLEVCRGLGG